MRSILTLLVGCTLAACSPNQGGHSDQAVPNATASADRSTKFDAVIRQLATVEGEFTREWDFSGDNTIFRRIGSLSDSGAVGDTAVAHLADCIGRTEPARATFRGSPISLGVVCYAALQHLAYHEEADSSGHLTPYWPGFLYTPEATPNQLAAAQRVWVKAAREGSYHHCELRLSNKRCS
jgi:hypothetical protein